MDKETKQEFENLASMVQKGFEQVDKRFEQVDKRFLDLDEKFEGRFKNIEQRLFSIEKILEEHGRILSSHTEELKGIHKVLDELANTSLQNTREVNDLKIRVNRIEEKVGVVA